MELKELQKYAKYLTTREGWGSEPIQTRLEYLECEVREVINEIVSHQTATTEEECEVIKQDIGYELFDILWNVAEIANRFDIDLEEASRHKIKLNNNRTFSDKPILQEVEE